MAVGIATTVLEIKNAVVVVVLLFLKHNSLRGRALSSSQWCSQSIPCTNFRARVTPFTCTLRARSKPCMQFVKACSVSWEVTFLYFFSWKFLSFGQKEPIKVPNFRLLTTHVKFHQMCTLIGSFCWKYIKLQLKKYRGVMSHDTEEWCKNWRKADLLFQNLQEFGEFWPKHSKLSKICTLIASFSAEYITLDLKKYRGIIFHENEEWCKIWRESTVVWKMTWQTWRILTWALKSLQNFHFNGLLLGKVYIVLAK